MNFNELLNTALKKLGKQEQLAIALDLAPSALSKRINGECGWSEREVNKLLELAGCEITDNGNGQRRFEIMKEALKLVLGEEK